MRILVRLSVLGLISISSPVFADAIIDPTAIDPTVNPCTDFYQYACGNWLAHTTIPADEARNERSFTALIHQNEAVLKDILENYAAKKMDPPTPYAQTLGDFYGSCMNESQVAPATLAYLKSRLDQIDAMKSVSDLPVVVAKMHLSGVPAFFTPAVNADLKDPTVYMAELDQGGLRMPNADYYNKDTFAAVRAKYPAHVAAMLSLTGMASADQAKALSSQIVGFESSLAAHALSPDQLQDPTTVYHPLPLGDVQKITPHFNWTSYYQALGAPVPVWINLTELDFFSNMDKLIGASDLSLLKAYMKWQMIEIVSHYSSGPVFDQWFSFQGTALYGETQVSERWKRCVDQVSESMDDALGQAYVAKAFSPVAKNRALEMIGFIRQAMANNLKSLSWLDEPTRQAALDKLSLVSVKVGYPDKWKSWDGLKMDRGQFAANVMAANEFVNAKSFARIGKPFDAAEWLMPPQMVNAYYDPSTNSINFPAGILQPPFFSADATDAENYGGIGMVIGHELTHGFDPSGSKFDGHGVNIDWWTAATRAHFDDSMSCLIKQYDQYQVVPASGDLPAVYINGDLTQTENTADQGGSKLGFMAYQLANAAHDNPDVAGFTPDQQYFIANAQSWCGKATDDYLRNEASSDPHSWDRFRIIGTVTNNPFFAPAFNCAVGTPMVPKNHCSVW